MRFLLDVNVLIALLWKEHSHHERAMRALYGSTLAVCPIVGLGFLRISSNPRAIGAEMAEARALLEYFFTMWKVTRIPDDLPALASKAETYDEVTDLCLADLAARHMLQFATFDSRISHGSACLIQ